jgi:hypothetical protein
MRSRKHKVRKQAYDQRAMRRALARKSLLKSDSKYLSRDEVHDRERLRETK